MEDIKKPYKKPVLEKILIDTDFSLIMMSGTTWTPPTTPPW